MINNLSGCPCILGKLSYFTNLNLAAIKWDDSPNPNQDEPGLGRTGFGRDEIHPDVSGRRCFAHVSGRKLSEKNSTHGMILRKFCGVFFDRKFD